jgi:formylglycine-generating enzyme required for sulfatase activity
MVHVPGGTFSMGSLTFFVGDEDEHPQHQVTLSGYCIDKTEVTVAAYTQCVVSGKCKAAQEPAKEGFDSLCNGTRADRQNHPINCVDWNQAVAYCAWVKKRLPSEAEWEYAARGGEGRTYPWGNEAPSAKRLNNCGGECRALGKRLGLGNWSVMYKDNDGWGATAPVGSFESGATPLGVLDMDGNVWEWTADWYGAYTAGASANPHGPKHGTYRVIRGGGWFHIDGTWPRGAYRGRDEPAIRHAAQGFRCARGD